MGLLFLGGDAGGSGFSHSAGLEHPGRLRQRRVGADGRARSAWRRPDRDPSPQGYR
ncbi:Hypothetical protein A7982_09681 [Minicystis rosea]|nr:Hypothetical protein A7982_09681 [Minicystis rosea]